MAYYIGVDYPQFVYNRVDNSGRLAIVYTSGGRYRYNYKRKLKMKSSMRITRIKVGGQYILYQRQRGKEKTVPLYFIQDTELGYAVAEFSNIRQARNWFNK